LEDLLTSLAFTSAVVAIAALGAARAANAQAVPAPPAAASAPADSADSDSQTVTVTGIRQKATATRQDVELRDLPQSVTVIDRQVLQDRAFTRVEDLGYATVNLQANTPYTGGVSIGFFSRGFNGSSLLVDGYNAGVVSGFTSNVFELASLERVEVLRGPASVLYGQGNPGGVLNLVLKRPRLSGFGADVDFQADSLGMRRATADVNVPVAKRLALRVVGVGEDSKTFRDFGRRRVSYLSPGLRWQPLDGTTVDALFSRADVRFNNDRGFGASETLIRSLPVERNLGEPWLPLSRVVSDSVRLEVTQRLADDWSLAAGWSENRLRTREGEEIGYTAIDGTTEVERYYIDYPNDDRNRARDRTVSLRLQGRFDDPLGLAHRLIVGAEKVDAFYLFEAVTGSVGNLDYLAPVYSTGPLAPATIFEDSGGGGSSGTRAVYLNDLISIGEHWKLQLGLRRDRITTLGYSDAVFTVGDSQRESKTTPSVGLVWQPTPTTAFYASRTTSFLPQFGRTRFGDILEPEQGRAFEVGWKQELLDRRLALTLSLFQIDKTNILQIDPADECCNINGGSARSRGLEFELQGRPWRGGQMQAGLGVADAKWTESNTFPVGGRLPGASPVTAVLSLKQRLGGGAEGGLAPLPAGTWVSASLAAGSKREWRPEGSAYKLPAYTRLDFAAAIPLSDRLELQFNLNNATDERLLLANGYGLVSPEAPRSVGFTLRFKSL
jgi:iron complex outermembrane recepter protein